MFQCKLIFFINFLTYVNLQMIENPNNILAKRRALFIALMFENYERCFFL